MSASEIQDVAPATVAGLTVAVTGATGFIGGRLVEMLAAEGAEVTCFVRGTNTTTRMHRAGARVTRLDLADAGAVSAALRSTDVVFHLAYDWNNTEWNFQALNSLIDACLANGTRLVFASSFVVYDLPDSGDVSEATAPTPAGDGYSHVKLQLEGTVLRACEERGLAASVLQPTIVYGPFCNPWTKNPAEQLRFGTVVLPGRGEGLCNAVYVDDVVSAMLLAATRPKAVGQRYLVSGPGPITWGMFYEGMAQAIGAKPPQYWPVAKIRERAQAGRLKKIAANPQAVIRRVANIGPVRKLVKLGLRFAPHGLRQEAQARLFGAGDRRPGHVHVPSLGHLQFLEGRTVIRTDKAERELGFKPAFDFKAGMVPTAKYLKSLDLG